MLPLLKLLFVKLVELTLTFHEIGSIYMTHFRRSSRPSEKKRSGHPPPPTSQFPWCPHTTKEGNKFPQHLLLFLPILKFFLSKGQPKQIPLRMAP